MKKNLILGVGEILMRLTAPDNYQFKTTNSYTINYGGGEFNVIACLSNWKINSRMLTLLPNNDFGDGAINFAKSLNVDMSFVKQTNNRMGLYFLEEGFSQRPSKIIYDRKDSAFSKISLNDFDLDAVFKDVTWIQMSGITPALNINTVLFAKQIIKYAKEHNIKICFDINWRGSLWNIEEATEILSDLVKEIDICIGVSPLKLNLNSNELLIPKKDSYEYYLALCRQINKVYNIKHIAFTNRESFKMNNNLIKCYYYNSSEDKLYVTNEVSVDVIDRIGTGDAFTAGIMYGVINNLDGQSIVHYGEAGFLIKHTIRGDVNTIDIESVNRYVENRNKPIKIVR